MKRLIFLSAVIFCLFSLDLTAQEVRSVEYEDSDFLMKAVSGGKMEVELGKLAVERAASGTIKEFGQKMIDDHSKANQELMNIISQKNIKISEDMLEKHKEHVEDMGARSGVDFDRAYMRLMVEDHMEDIRVFEGASKNYPDEEVKNWAERTLPVLKQHFELAKQISKIMGASEQSYQ